MKNHAHGQYISQLGYKRLFIAEFRPINLQNTCTMPLNRGNKCLAHSCEIKLIVTGVQFWLNRSGLYDIIGCTIYITCIEA